ncbi:MAG: efflux RND transporter periplasmic adaptor subunit [Phycisphaerae bacterium]
MGTSLLGCHGCGISIALCVLFAPAVGVGMQRADDRHGVPYQPEPEDFKVVGMTVPSKVATLAAVSPARIARILAPEGGVVREGDLVIALEDGVQLAKTEIAKARAKSTLDIELARVRWEHAKREWDRLAKLHGDDHASSKELSDVLADAEVARLEYELAHFIHEQALLAHEREQKLLDEFRLRAPFSGYVSDHVKQVGETVDQLEGILTLVQLDPLQVVVDCPVSLAPFILVTDRVWIRPVDSHWPPRVGTVALASRVADGASQTFRVKINVSNEDHAWLSGLKVVVDFAGEIDPLTVPHDSQHSAGAEDRPMP